ncbi:FAS1-like dehydratase domain-containing protein [Streptomyces sp. YGL11-2]|uniref:FAS1-like dehydratase domain-containing protein n=1 Tax=Streptomyces sp. YGL11-2 TaxID=3414028 RepID=UPI003CF7B658
MPNTPSPQPDQHHYLTSVLPPISVDRARIAEFADAVGDPNPVYRDPAAARAYGHPDVITPPTFAIWISSKAEQAILDSCPGGFDFSSAVHTTQSFRLIRPIRSGDVLTARARTVDLKPSLGGVLLTTEVSVHASEGELVCVTTSALLSRHRQGTHSSHHDC